MDRAPSPRQPQQSNDGRADQRIRSVRPVPSLTLAEARARAALLSDVSYDVELDLTDPSSFASRVTVRFAASGPETFLELHRATDLAVTVNGTPVDPAYAAGRIALTGLAERNEVVVAARLPYVTDGEGMHTFTDPADGERYVSAYVGIDITQRVFACFDQVDLKAPVSLRVVADPAWTVLSNAPLATTRAGVREFAPTPPIPVDLFVVCAGPWHSRTFEHAGLPMGWHARRSLAAELDRDLDELQRTTVACFDHYTSVFDEPFPFASYHQVFVPGLNWGAMENPGCVTYRDELLGRGRVRDEVRRLRAMVIAHEMSHMWFGDLVTQRWWDDTWLNESFADYMGFEVAQAVAGFPGTRLSFETRYKPGGYAADRRRSTHPVAPLPEDVPDVDTASSNFDEISYAKGNAVVRQLVTWLGTDDFLAGVNAHLTRHRFANATLDDLVEALDAVSPRDVRAWARVWLRSAGHDTVRVVRDGDVPVLVREGTRPHRLRVSAYDDAMGAVGDRWVDLDDKPVPLTGWSGLVVVPNSSGETFARVDLDEHSRQVADRHLLAVADPLARGLLWTLTFDLPLADQLDVLDRHLAAEPHPTLVEALVEHLERRVLPQQVPPADAAAVHARLAARFRAGLADSPEEQRALALSGGLALTSHDTAELQRWLAADRTDQGHELDPALRWSVVRRLSGLGALDQAGIEAERRRDGTVEGELGAATALAARPTPEAKAQAWAAMSEDPEVSNRHFSALARGLWSPEQADLVAPYVAAYVTAAPGLAARGSAFAAAVGRAFPALFLDDAQLGLVRTALGGDVPPVLRRSWEDSLDDRA